MKRVSGRSGMGAKPKAIDISGLIWDLALEKLKTNHNIVNVNKFIVKVYKEDSIRVKIYEYKSEKLVNAVDLKRDSRFVDRGYKFSGMEIEEYYELMRYLLKVDKLKAFI